QQIDANEENSYNYENYLKHVCLALKQKNTEIKSRDVVLLFESKEGKEVFSTGNGPFVLEVKPIYENDVRAILNLLDTKSQNTGWDKHNKAVLFRVYIDLLIENAELTSRKDTGISPKYTIDNFQKEFEDLLIYYKTNNQWERVATGAIIFY